MDKYKTCILELVRNNGVLQEEKSESARFLMFDYFDILYYKELEGDEKHYMNYFSLGDPFKNDKDYKVSYKFLGLYQKWKKIEESADPFLPGVSQQLSDKPFLGIVQISLCTESFVKKNITDGVEEFLEFCEKKIEEIATATCKDSIKCLYRSTNTGDFCLVLRTSCVEKIYQTALELNRYVNTCEKEDQFQVKFCTYTSVGLECAIGEDGKYCTLNKEFIEKNRELKVALRFSASSSLAEKLNRLKQTQENKEEYEVKKGVFGRYDYLIHVSIQEFADIYPILCEKKLGRPKVVATVKTELQEIISDSSVKNINERILVSLGSFNVQNKRADSTENTTQENEIDRRNKKLFKNIINLKEKKNCFSEEYRTFCDLFRGTRELYKTFSSIGIEEDAYINWLIFYNDMEILCRNLNHWIERVEDGAKSDRPEENRKWRISTLKNWRNNIQSINEYTQLVQNVNYQNYQSPIYEIQTQSDTEKLLVAYREVMEVYFDSYKENQEQNEHIHPIIYPDLSRNTVEVTASFLPIEGVQKCERMAVCTVPSFEYFGRLYDLLPWIMHESSHHVRVLSREVRNRFVIQYDMSYIFRQVVADILKELSDDKFYGGLGKAEDDLVESFMMALKDIYQTEELEKYKKCNFEVLVKELEKWLKDLFQMEKHDTFSVKSTDMDDMYRDACNVLLNEYRSYGKVNEKLCNDFERLYKRRGGMKLVEELIERIMKVYQEDLQELQEIPVTSYIKLEDFMLPQKMLEERLEVLWKYRKDNPFGHRLIEYSYSVKKLFRVYCTLKELSDEDSTGNDFRKDFLEKTAKYYEKKIEEHGEEETLKDPSITYVLRRLGLQNKNSHEFVEVMDEMLQKFDGSRIWDFHKLRIGTYREACADLFMAISLHMTAFGYCNQVFHTISAARLQIDEYDYENINYARMRVIAAVLLCNDDPKLKLGTKGDIVSVNGEKLLKQGDKYCLNTLKCIQREIEESEELKAVEQTKIQKFLGAIYGQIQGYLENPDGETYQSMLLYHLLHHEKGNLRSRTKKIWDENQDITKICKNYKHLFWRIECFLVGLSYIMETKEIRVEKDIYDYMSNVYKKAHAKEDTEKGDCELGCCWENGLPKYLLEPKEKIGEFYNEPEMMYTERPAQKLENTIDFIQNYYYHNRFRLGSS